MSDPFSSQLKFGFGFTSGDVSDFSFSSDLVDVAKFFIASFLQFKELLNRLERLNFSGFLILNVFVDFIRVIVMIVMMNMTRGSVDVITVGLIIVFPLLIFGDVCFIIFALICSCRWFWW